MNKMRRIILLSLLLLIVLGACRLESEERTGPLHIVATTGIIEDALVNIVGDSAEVSALMGPGTDPHLYKPTPFDVELLEEADVIVCNGLHLEGKMSEMLRKYGASKPVIEVAGTLTDKDLIQAIDAGDSYDSHIWFDPAIWVKGLAGVCAELIKVEPENEAYYQKNFEKYKFKIDDMSIWVEKQIATLNDSSKVLITSHDAFSYFGKKYGIEVRGIQGVSTLSEVGLKDISQMVDFVIERQIPAIFVETSTSDKTAQAILEGTKQKGFELRLEGPLYSDALGEPGGEAGTYIGMFKANVGMIVSALKNENQ